MSLFRDFASSTSALNEYLDRKRQEFIAFSGPVTGQADYERLCSDLTRLQDRVNALVITAEAPRQECFLVAGRVQSGKTGHQLGMLAWAAEHCDAAVLFTGVTEALNQQTTTRIAKDLQRLPSAPVNTLKVPTRGQISRSSPLFRDISARISARMEGREGNAVWRVGLPVLTSMKTVPRVNALSWMFEELNADHSGDLIVLFIDDEADQASPNAHASRGEEAATYRELKELRASVPRNAWLSYTATPQAIFLTEAEGALRPNRCVFVAPGHEYFGLEDLLDARRGTTRIPVFDWDQDSVGSSWYPKSLRSALLDFLCSGWLRQNAPEDFYASSSLSVNAEQRLRSVQMLIHTDSRVASHLADYEAVTTLRADLLLELEAAIRDEGTVADLDEAWRQLRARIASIKEPSIAEKPGISIYHAIGQLLQALFVRVVNSSSNPPGSHDGPLPSSNDEWERHQLWVVIGGDILGRGLTLPQLTSMYFMRAPITANEDTVAQQMRFAGYRKTYSHVFRLYADAQALDTFQDIEVAESAFLSRVRHWDARNVDLKAAVPQLWYVVRPGGGTRPTRLGVRDRALVDKTFGRQVFSARRIFSPAVFRHNTQLLLNWWGTGASGDLAGWSFQETDTNELCQLLGSMRMSGADGSDRSLALELLDPSMGMLGLHDLPVVVLVRQLGLLESSSGSGFDLGSVGFGRRLRGVSRQEVDSLPWTLATDSQASPLRTTRWWDRCELDVQHIGGAQRAAMDLLPYDCLHLIVEPLAGQIGGANVAAGLATSLIAPSGMEVRAIGIQAP